MEPARKPSILVVDDAPENIDVLKQTLKDDYQVRPAINGEVALRIATSANPPDLILLDVIMPGMDGYEVMRRLHADPATSAIPVIFVTALGDQGAEVLGLELGAVDYIAKPISPPVVKARVQTHLALRGAAAQLEDRQRIMLRERETVENIITRMRRSKFFDERHLRYHLSSVDRTNGDILLAAFTPDGRQRVLVGDITGHGLPAAVAAPLLSHVFYREAERGGAIADTLILLNQVMCRQFPVNIFMVACLLEVSAERDAATLWNAGMPACLWRREGQTLERLAARSLPLGIVEEGNLAAERYELAGAPGDLLYLFSDGVTETARSDGTLFGVEGVEAFLAAHPAGAAPLENLIDTLGVFHGSTDFADDLTFVEVCC